MRNDYKALMEEDFAFKRLVRQEELILEVTEALANALQQTGMSRSELASTLGCTRGFVSQLFAGGRNLTLRTISDVALALGVRPRLKLCCGDDRSQDVVEAISVSQWVVQGPKIVLHPSSFSNDREREREQMIA